MEEKKKEKKEGMVLLERRGSVAILSVNRPKALNALSRGIIDEVETVLDGIAEDSGILALIVGGTENFAAGADIKGMVECDPDGARAFAFNVCYNKLENLSIPTIAAIDGYALGGGLELALCCDMRIATHNARLGLPETGLGIMPGAGGTIRLPRMVGYAKACEIILTGAQLSGQEAEHIGLVNKAVSKEELMETAVKWAGRAAAKSPMALAVAKQTMRRGLELESIEEGIELEADKWAELFATEDQKEGMRAFIEKRKPSFTGQ